MASSNSSETFGTPLSSAQFYDKLSDEFSSCHQNEANIFLHLFTTPVGFLGCLILLHAYTKSSSAALTLMAAYVLSLLPVVPNGVFIGTFLLCGGVIAVARKMKTGWIGAVLLVVFGYVLQDVAHMVTGEITFQSTYSDGGQIDLKDPLAWFRNFSVHTYYLIPLCVHIALPYLKVSPAVRLILDSPLPDEMQKLHAFAWLLTPLLVFALGAFSLDSKNKFCIFPGAPYFYRVLQCNLTDEGEKEKGADGKSSKHKSKAKDMTTIRDWVLAKNPSEDKSSHWWYKELAGAQKESFENCANASQISSVFRELFSEKNYCMDVIEGMNEIYVTGPRRDDEAANSDNVFYSRHVDGPFGMLPFVSCYRCIVGMDNNQTITTHFPLAGVDKNACTGDVLAFDFNREVHYITKNDAKRLESDKFRVVLKLHYCIYPRVLAPMGWLMSFLNTRYNQGFRALFLKTINPQSPYEHFLAWNVNFQTWLMDIIETVVGQRNVLYLLMCLGLWRATRVYEVFFALTSLVHYCRYISTYYIRREIDFGSFKRDVLFFKILSLAQLFYHYLLPSTQSFVFDPVSVFMIISGYTISLLATNALGVDRTYFGAELGVVPNTVIIQFPYGYIPHPMIVSQIWALLGLYKASHFRTEWPYVVPMHVCLYLCHMAQEQFRWYDKTTDADKASYKLKTK